MLSTANMAFFGGAVVLVASLAADPVKDFWYDDSTPFVENTLVEPESVETKPGETIRIRYKFTKRAGCHGRVTYRLIGHPKDSSADAPAMDIPIIDTVAGWPSGGPQERVTPVTIPAYVPAGRYDLIWIAMAPECEAVEGQKAASRGHIMESRSKPVEVVVRMGSE